VDAMFPASDEALEGIAYGLASLLDAVAGGEIDCAPEVERLLMGMLDDVESQLVARQLAASAGTAPSA
jgi:hypothetical protein